jgi:hypothetical protein
MEMRPQTAEIMPLSQLLENIRLTPLDRLRHPVYFLKVQSCN